MRAKTPAALSKKVGSAKVTKTIGWQGFTVDVPLEWDLTGFSGSFVEGYFRVDDSETIGLEVKWGTLGKKAKPLSPSQLEGRAESFLNSLKLAAKKKKLAFEMATLPPFKSVERSERNGVGFRWSADRLAMGVVWYCETCRRVVIAQLIGEPDSRAGLKNIAEKVLGTLCCHGTDPQWNLWSLYDLNVQIPAAFLLESQKLMNVYIRLSFATKSNNRLSVEQWGMANVARRDQYLDDWVIANAKGELSQSRYTVTETEIQTHPAILFSGGLGMGNPMMKAMQEIGRLQWPATRFSGAAWECEASNKVYLLEQLRPSLKKERDWVAEIAERSRCHQLITDGTN